jgi:quercetin dioxygenase-like cupin family protein
MITSSTERLASYSVETTAAQKEHSGDLEISSRGAAPGAANMNPTESIGFSRGRQSLDHSVWYNGALMTFLATGEDTQRQFGLIEVFGRRGNVPPPHIHHKEDEIFYVLEGEIIVSVGDHTMKGTPGTMIFLPRDVRHSFTIESEQFRMLNLVTPAGFEAWFREFGVPAPAMTLPPPANEPAYGEVQRMLEAAPRYGLDFVLP